MQDEHTTDRPEMLAPRLRLERPEQTADQRMPNESIDDRTGDLEGEGDDRDPLDDVVE